MAKFPMTILAVLMLVGCNLLGGATDQQARKYLAKLPQGAASSCEAATDLVALGLNLAGLGSAQVSLAASGFLGERSSLEVTRDLEGIMKPGGYTIATQVVPFTGTLMTFTTRTGGFLLLVLDSGLFTQNKLVCYYQVG
jgi:hypothetical protein